MRASGKGKGEKKIRNELTEKQKREIEDAYEPFSETGIEPKELKLAMKALGFDPNNEEVQKIMAQVDKKGKTPISYADFLDIMIEKPTDNPQAEMKKAFKILCEDGKDKITFKSLKKICTELGENITDEELQEMLTEADRDQDEEVGEEDFCKIMQKTNMF